MDGTTPPAAGGFVPALPGPRPGATLRPGYWTQNGEVTDVAELLMFTALLSMVVMR